MSIVPEKGSRVWFMQRYYDDIHRIVVAQERIADSLEELAKCANNKA